MGIGKLHLHDDWKSIVDREIKHNNLNILPIGLHHTYALRELQPLHRDPFDRMLMAQSICDELIRQYTEVTWVWH